MRSSFANEQLATWKDLITGPRSSRWLNLAIERVARTMSEVTNRPLRHTMPQTDRVPIDQIATYGGDPEAKTVGIYLQIHGDMFGQALLLLSESSALHLVDWMMDKPHGTATNLGLAERSALGEFGNLAVSHFLNALVSFSRLPSRLQPSPPAVMVDMISSILSLVAMPLSIKHDTLLIVKSDLRDAGSIVQMRFWIFPDPQIAEV
ncbi:MAG: hypothetical protein JXA89_27820 [Anaerolineae bacterium]|nr:hypothetical protein [Anaerolineae bacterium]